MSEDALNPFVVQSRVGGQSLEGEPSQDRRQSNNLNLVPYSHRASRVAAEDLRLTLGRRVGDGFAFGIAAKW
jgi:hypothetical protein